MPSHRLQPTCQEEAERRRIWKSRSSWMSNMPEIRDSVQLSCSLQTEGKEQCVCVCVMCAYVCVC